MGQLQQLPGKGWNIMHTKTQTRKEFISCPETLMQRMGYHAQQFMVKGVDKGYSYYLLHRNKVSPIKASNYRARIGYVQQYKGKGVDIMPSNSQAKDGILCPTTF